MSTAYGTKEERVRKYGEVFTPPEIVDRMLDALEQENPGCFAPGTTFLEPTCGDGAFVTEILRRKFRNCRSRTEYRIALESVWAMELLADNVESCIRRAEAVCREFFRPTKAELDLLREHVIQCDSLKLMKLLNWWNRQGEI